MKSKKRLYWLLQCVVWGTYYMASLLLVSSIRQAVTLNLLLWIVCSFLCSVLLSHLLRGLIIRLKLLSLRFSELFLSTAFLVFIAAVLLEMFQYSLSLLVTQDFLQNPDTRFLWADFFIGTERSTILFGTWTFFYYLYVLKFAKDNLVQRNHPMESGV